MKTLTENLALVAVFTPFITKWMNVNNSQGNNRMLNHHKKRKRSWVKD